MTDPIADFLTRIRNALIAGHASVAIPTSTMKVRLAEILKEEGYRRLFRGRLDTARQHPHSTEVDCSEACGDYKLRRESKPGQRRYVKGSALPRVRNGHGIAIISTSKGVMTGREARRQGVGGEFICSVY